MLRLRFNVLNMKVSNIVCFGFLLIMASNNSAFNIDTDFPIIFKGDKDSMFGFSLTMVEQDSQIWLYVGSPKGNKIVKEGNATFSHQNGVGTVQICNASYVWTDENSCKNMVFYKEPGKSSIHDLTGFSMTIVPHRSPSQPNTLLFCAPMWSKKFYQLGKCYEAKVGQRNNVVSVIILGDITVDSRFVYYSAGFSVHSFKNGDIFYGIPGANDCKGLIMIEKSSGVRSNFTLTPKITHSYLGFSIYSGKFTKEMTEFLVSGSPKFNETGRVDIFNELHTSIWSEVGSQMGSYFGSVLCTVDVNNDGCDDLLIGSPMHTEKIAMEGKVNLYISQCSIRISFWDPIPLFGSKGRNARFGSAISDVGDLNHDLYKDIVIGAPFENDNIGCIYIYNGKINGLDLNSEQRICGKTVKPDLSGFGWSISKSADIDKNGYNDFAVSALMSNKVAILRGRPIIEVFVDMDLNNATVYESNTINITLIFLYNTRYSFSNDLVLGYKLDVDTVMAHPNKRVHLIDPIGTDTDIGEKITLRRNESVSKTVTAIVKSKVTDFLSPVRFNLSYCIQSHKNVVNSLRPIFNKKEDVVKVLRFEKKCSSDDKCEADLILSMFYRGKVFVNETKKITLEVTILNLQDDAFVTTAVFKFRNKISYYGIKNSGNSAVSCLEQSNQVECDIANPLSEGGKVKFLLEFKVSIIPLDEIDQPIVIDGEVMTQSQEKHPDDNTKRLDIPLNLFATPELNVKTVSTPVKYNKEDELSINNSKSFVMATDFIIHNLGPSYLPETVAVFNIPRTIPDENILFTSTDMHVTIKNFTLKCNIELENRKTNTTTLPSTTTSKISTLSNKGPSIHDDTNIQKRIRVTKQAVTDCHRSSSCFKVRCKVPEIAVHRQIILSLHLNFSNSNGVFKILDYLQIAIEMQVINEANTYLYPWKKTHSIIVQLSFLADMLSGKPINYIWVAGASAAGAFCCIMFLWFLIWKYRCCVTKMQHEIHVIKRESIKRRTRRQTSHEGVQYKSINTNRSTISQNVY
ncbi:uncharacterized protein LOC115214909 [Argonauta hians]